MLFVPEQDTQREQETDHKSGNSEPPAPNGIQEIASANTESDHYYKKHQFKEVHLFASNILGISESANSRLGN
jgi:hypothetical protein